MRGRATAPLSAVLVAALIAALVPRAAAAQETARPSLEVVFRMAEPAYRQAFTDAQIAELEDRTRTRLAAALELRIGFLQFVTTDEPTELRIDLGSAGASGVHAVDFVMTIDGPLVVRELQPLAWPFRSAAQARRPLGSLAGFEEEIATAFERSLQTAFDPLVTNLLGKLRLAGTALPLQLDDCSCWVLPFSKRELGADAETEFELRADLESAVGTKERLQRLFAAGESLGTGLPPPFQLKLLAELRDPAMASEMRRATRVTARELLLIRLRPLVVSALDEPLLPSELPVEDQP